MATSRKRPLRDGVPVEIRLYKWAGRWGPFRIKIPCGECALTEDVIHSTIGRELANAKVSFVIKDWLSHWWEPLKAGGYHAPIVLVDGRLIAQGDALNRGVLARAAMEHHVARFPIEGNHLFGKDRCGHCRRAKTYLENAGIAFAYHDVVENPGAMFEMLLRVKPLIGERTPITTPQIFLDGVYVGGADDLARRLGIEVEPDPRRGRGSLSPSQKLSAARRRSLLALVPGDGAAEAGDTW